MRYLTEFRDPATARRLLEEIRARTRGPRAIMEVCGGQTHSLLRHGIDRLLPEEIELIHGPGCPVCVTPASTIDRALAIAGTPGATLCTFGDMLRVPGTKGDLFRVKSAGGDARVVYSPLEAVDLARRNRDREVVFFAIGFETTAPANAMAALQARRLGLGNFSMLTSHVRVPPAIEAILESPGNRVEAFLAAGHVCGVMGWREYPAICERHGTPIVVTGFEPLDLLEGIRRALAQLEEGRAEVENAYGRMVTFEGNAAARRAIEEVFEVCDREWRGIGVIRGGGLRLREAFRDLDAEARFPAPAAVAGEDEGGGEGEAAVCRSGEVLRGTLKPTECAAFGKRCTPRTPLGATMVSGEGACAAYYHYGRLAGAGSGSGSEASGS